MQKLERLACSVLGCNWLKSYGDVWLLVQCGCCLTECSDMSVRLYCFQCVV